MTYKAFISYSHAADGKLAPALQSGLHWLDKSWYRMRALRVFRDKTSLSASPGAWPSIEKALSESEWFILMASPDAAQSIWVIKEVDWWLANRSIERLLIVWTDGGLTWDNSMSDFDWERTTALPFLLGGQFKYEPLYVDLRWAKSEEKLSLRHTQFRAAVLDLAAPLHGKAKDVLDGEDVQQHRKTQIIAWSAGLAMVLLTVSAVIAAVYAFDQKHQSEKKTRVVTSQLLATESRNLMKQLPQQSLLLASAAVQVTSKRGEGRVPLAEQALREALAYSGGVGLAGHDKDIVVLTISPSGRWLITGSEDGTARVWDLVNQDPVASSRVLSGHAGQVNTILVSSDNSLLVTASSLRNQDKNRQKGSVRIWRIGPQLLDIRLLNALDIDTGMPFAAGFDRNNNPLIIERSNDKKQLRLWKFAGATNPSTSISVFSIPDHHLGFDDQAEFRDDVIINGHWLAATSSFFRGSVQFETLVWDLNDAGPGPKFVLSGGTDGISISPDGRWLVTANEVHNKGHIATVWDLTGKLPLSKSKLLIGHGYFIRKLAFSSDSRWLVTGSWDNRSLVWDLSKQNPEDKPIALEYGANAVAVSPNNRWVATAGKFDFSNNSLTTDNNVYLWDLERKVIDPEMKPIVLRGHERHVSSIIFDSESRRLITGSWDGTARLWDIQAAQYIASPIMLRGHKGEVESLAISSNNHLVSGSGSQAILWDLNASSPGPSPVKVIAEEDASTSRVLISPDGRWVVSWDGDKGDIHAYAWALTEKSVTTSRKLRHEAPVSAASISPDNRWVATGSQNSVYLWDLNQETTVGRGPQVLKGHRNAVEALLFSPDSRWLVSGSWDTTVRLWDLSSANLGSHSIELAGHGDIVQALAISSDGKWLATGSTDRTVKLWNLVGMEPGKPPTKTFKLDYDVTTLAISSDNRWLVATSHTHPDVSLFALATRDFGKPPKVLRKHSAGVASLTFSPDSHWLATGSYDNSTCLWDLQAEDSALEPVILRPGQDGQSGVVHSMVFSSDSHWLVTTGNDEKVRIWNLRLEELLALAHRTVGRTLRPGELSKYASDL